MKSLTHDFKLVYLVVYALLLGGIFTAVGQTTGIPYQAYITTNIDVPGEAVEVPLANTEILLEFIVRDENGDEEYREHILVTTDKYGLASTIVGAGYGTPQNGTDFSDIDWGGLKKTLDIGVDFTNAGDFSDHGEMPIMYIPGPGDVIAQGITTSMGAPTGTGDAGDIYVDETTGDIYTSDGTEWKKQNAVGNVVSADADNVVVEGTDGLAYVDAIAIANAVGTTAGVGAPTGTGDAGDIYVDETTGDIYSSDGTEWTQQNVAGNVVSADTSNLVVEGSDGLAFFDQTALTAIETLTTIAQDATAGTVTYTDEAGADTVLDLNTLIDNAETLTELSVQSSAGPDGIAGTADDVDELVYQNEEGTTNTIDISSLIKAENGLSVAGGNVVMGGDLINPTTVTTDATNTLAVDGLEAPADTDDYDIVTVDNTTGVLKKIPISSLGIRRYVQIYTAADGDIQFVVPQAIADAADLDNIDVYRNGVRIDFTQVNTNTVQLDLGALAGCYAGDKIRIVQLQ